PPADQVVLQLGDDGVELVNQKVKLAAGDAQRRGDEEDVPGPAEETVPFHQQARSAGEPGFLREGLLGRAVGDDLDRGDEAEPPAYLPDDSVAVQLLQTAEQVAAHVGRVPDQELALENVQVREPGRARDRVPAERDAVVEGGPGRAGERVGDVLGGDGGPDWHVAAGQGLGDDGDVRHDPPVLGGEHPAG